MRCQRGTNVLFIIGISNRDDGNGGVDGKIKYVWHSVVKTCKWVRDTDVRGRVSVEETFPQWKEESVVIMTMLHEGYVERS